MTQQADITIEVESWQKFYLDPDRERLWQEQYANRYGSQKKLKLKVSVDKYANMGASLIVIVARKSGRMVGYCLLVLAPSLHYESLDLYENTYWVSLDERYLGVGKSLFLKAIELGKQLNANRIFFSDKNSISIQKLLDSLDFQMGETIYELELTERSS